MIWAGALAAVGVLALSQHRPGDDPEPVDASEAPVRTATAPSGTSPGGRPSKSAPRPGANSAAAKQGPRARPAPGPPEEFRADRRHTARVDARGPTSAA